MRQEGKKSTTVKSIARAVDVLKVLSVSVNRISDISQRLSLSNSTVHRLLKTLEEADLVMKDPVSHRYYLGHLLIKLASDPFVTHQRLIACAHNPMQYLNEYTGESVTLHIRFGMQRVRLAEMSGAHDIRYVGRPTIADPLWAGSMGKVLLAQLPDNELKVVMENAVLTRLAAKTIMDKSVLMAEIQKVRMCGYGTSYGETITGISAISAPVKNYVEPVALSIVGPEYRFAATMMEYLDELRKAAAQVSQSLLKQ